LTTKNKLLKIELEKEKLKNEQLEKKIVVANTQIGELKLLLDAYNDNNKKLSENISKISESFENDIVVNAIDDLLAENFDAVSQLYNFFKGTSSKKDRIFLYSLKLGVDLSTYYERPDLLAKSKRNEANKMPKEFLNQMDKSCRTLHSLSNPKKTEFSLSRALSKARDGWTGLCDKYSLFSLFFLNSKISLIFANFDDVKKSKSP